MQEFIDFMPGRDFQEALPDNMYVYPVDSTVPLPEGWKKYAPASPKPYVEPAEPHHREPEHLAATVARPDQQMTRG